MNNRYRITFEIDCEYADPSTWNWRFLRSELDDESDQVAGEPTVTFLGPTRDFLRPSDFDTDIDEMQAVESLDTPDHLL